MFRALLFCFAVALAISPLRSEYVLEGPEISCPYIAIDKEMFDNASWDFSDDREILTDEKMAKVFKQSKKCGEDLSWSDKQIHWANEYTIASISGMALELKLADTDFDGWIETNDFVDFSIEELQNISQNPAAHLATPKIIEMAGESYGRELDAEMIDLMNNIISVRAIEAIAHKNFYADYPNK